MIVISDYAGIGLSEYRRFCELLSSEPTLALSPIKRRAELPPWMSSDLVARLRRIGVERQRRAVRLQRHEARLGADELDAFRELHVAYERRG